MHHPGVAAVALIVVAGISPSHAETLPEPNPVLRGLFDAVVPYVADDQSAEDIARFEDGVTLAFETILGNHVFEPDESDLIEGAMSAIEARASFSDSNSADLLTQVAIHGMLAKVDPDSFFIPSERFRRFRADVMEFPTEVLRVPAGIGAELTIEGDFPVVEMLRYGTPAFQANLRSGDVITHIDGEEMKGIPLEQTVKRLRGSHGVSPTVTVRRDSMPPFDVKLNFDLIRMMPVKYNIIGDIAYVRIGHMDERARRLLPLAFELLLEDAGDRLSGFVLDLRRSSGSAIDVAIAWSDLLLGDGPIAGTRHRYPERDLEYSGTAGARFEGIPLAVLIDSGTSGVAELVAGALQDNRRGVLFGEGSAGGGHAMEDFDLGDGRSLILPVARFEMPSGRLLDSTGVLPDVLVGSEPNAAVQDLGIFARERCRIGNEEAGDDAVFGCALAFVRAGTIARLYSGMR